MLIHRDDINSGKIIIKEVFPKGNNILVGGKPRTLAKCISFDTETKEAEVYGYYQTMTEDRERVYSVASHGSTEKEDTYYVTFKCTLHNFSAFNTETGEEIK